MNISRWNRTTSLLALQLSVDHMLGLDVCEEEPRIYLASRRRRPISSSKDAQNSPSRRPLRRVQREGLPQAPFMTG